jgi:hypothetical protein
MSFMAAADDAEGKINGTVKDPDGAVVAGACVSLLHSHRIGHKPTMRRLDQTERRCFRMTASALALSPDVSEL